MKFIEIIVNRRRYEADIQSVASSIEKELSDPKNDTRERVDGLLIELDELFDKYFQVVCCINTINQTEFVDGERYSDILLDRDMHLECAKKLRSFADASTVSQSRVRNTEIKLLPVMDSGILDQKADKHQAIASECEMKLQRAHWTLECTMPEKAKLS